MISCSNQNESKDSEDSNDSNDPNDPNETNESIKSINGFLIDIAKTWYLSNASLHQNQTEIRTHRRLILICRISENLRTATLVSDVCILYCTTHNKLQRKLVRARVK